MGFVFRLSQITEPSSILNRCLCIICPCCRRKHSSSPAESITSVRRISRVRSDDSLDDVGAEDKFEESDEVMSLSSSVPSSPGIKFPAKISFRSIASKAMKKSHSTLGYEYQSDDGCGAEGKSETSKKLRKICFNKHFSTASEIDPSDEKEKFKVMLKESRRKFRENKGKQYLIFPFNSIAALPSYSSCEQGSLSGILQDESSGSLQKTVFMKEAVEENSSAEGTLEELELSTFQKDSPLRVKENNEDFLTKNYISDPLSTISDRGEGDGSTMEVGCKDNPTSECFGSVTAAVKIISSKIISVNVVSLQGLPCRQGQDNGLTLELKISPGGSSVWLPYPLARGSKITINSEISMKLPTKNQKISSFSKNEDLLVQISVWVAGRTSKHCCIGNAIICLLDTKEVPSNIGLYQHTKLTDNIGTLEVGLISSADDSKSYSVKKITSKNVALTIHILRAKFNKNLSLGKSFTAIRQLKRSKRDIWCRISLWSKGRRVERICTSRIYLPVTNDPNFRTTVSFHVSRSSLPYTSIIIKIMCDRGLGEDVIGKLILGPHLYLGVSEGLSPSTTLSHWGRALTHGGIATMWHKLYL